MEKGGQRVCKNGQTGSRLCFTCFFHSLVYGSLNGNGMLITEVPSASALNPALLSNASIDSLAVYSVRQSEAT